MESVDRVRVQLPWWRETKLDPWEALKFIGSLIGKDLSQMALPINFYEPMTVL